MNLPAVIVIKSTVPMDHTAKIRKVGFQCDWRMEQGADVLKGAGKMRRFKRIIAVLIVLAVCVGGVYLWSWCEGGTIDLSYYTVHSEKVEGAVRVVLLTDLHQKIFGKDNQKLFDRIGELSPDIIFIAGDVINSDNADIDYAVNLCDRLQKIAPVYYGMGNHENRVVYGMDLTKKNLDAAGGVDASGDFSALVKDNRLFDGLKATGATVLQNSSAIVEINGNSIAIGGISTDRDASWPYSGGFLMDFMTENAERCEILLSHFPSPAHALADSGIDLILSGHNHGGVIRLPGIGGLYADGEGLFPEDDAGMSTIGTSTLIISRGIGSHGWIPRLFNPPELVVIDIS